MTQKTDEPTRKQIRTDLDTSYLVEAAAGTGKTYELVRRAYNLIRTGKVKDVTRLVAITFTEKAAGELKNEIRELISRGIEGDLDRETDDIPNPGEGEEGDAETERARLHRARDQIDGAHFSTIHAFASDILRKHPVEAGVDPSFEVLDDISMDMYLEQEFEPWWREQMSGANTDMWERLFEIGDSKTRKGSVKSTVEQLVSDNVLREYILEGSYDGFTVDEKRSIAEEIQDCVPDLLQAFDEERVGSADGGTIDTALLRVREFLDGVDTWTEDTLDTFFDPTGEQGGLFKYQKKVKEGNGFEQPGTFGSKSSFSSAGDKTKDERRDRVCSLYNELVEKWLPVAEEHYQKRFLEPLREIASFAEQLKQRLQQDGYLTYSDLLFRARNLLRDHKDIRRSLQRQYDAFLIDETQDTDPLQTEIIFYLSGDPDVEHPADHWNGVELADGKLFMVGDPKQSIYRFRGADIQQYDKYKQTFDDEEQLTLNRNFRSVPSILNWIDSLFGEAQHGLMKAITFDGAKQAEYVQFHGSEKRTNPPNTGQPDVNEPGPYVVTPLVNEDNPVNVPPSMTDGDADERRTHQATVTAELIETIRNNPQWQITNEDDPDNAQQITYRDIAVLIPKRTGLEQLEGALQANGIPFHHRGGYTLFQSSELQQLAAVTSAVMNPSSREKTVPALVSPFFGLDLQEVTRFLQNGRWSDSPEQRLENAREHGHDRLAKAFETLDELRSSARTKTIAAWLDELYDRTQALSLYRLKPSGERRVKNLLKIRDMARKRQARGLLDFPAFTRWLTKNVENGDTYQQEGESEGEALVAEETEDSVSILTIHKAKGLDFPVVIMPFLQDDPPGTVDSILERTANDRASVKFGSQAYCSLYYGRQEEREKQFLAAEEIRVDYVSLTRTRDYVFLPQMIHPDEFDEDDGFYGRIGLPQFGDEEEDETNKQWTREQVAEQFRIDPEEANERIHTPDELELEVDTESVEQYGTTHLPEVPEDPQPSADYETEVNEWNEQRERKQQQGKTTLHITATGGKTDDRIKDLFLTPENEDAWTEAFDDTEQPDPVLPDDFDPRGTALGNTLHDLLEHTDLRDPDDEQLMERIESAATNFDHPDAGQTIEELIRGVLDGPAAEWARSSHRLRYEFTLMAKLHDLPVSNEEDDSFHPETVIEGVVDLLLAGEDGIHLVDYKTTKQSNIDENVDGHAAQLEAYRSLVDHALDQPVDRLTLYYLDGPVAVTRDI